MMVLTHVQSARTQHGGEQQRDRGPLHRAGASPGPRAARPRCNRPRRQRHLLQDPTISTLISYGAQAFGFVHTDPSSQFVRLKVSPELLIQL